MSPRETRFSETMLGTVRLDGREPPRRIRLDLHARADGVLRPWATTRAGLTGRVRITGMADDPHATGELEISPSPGGASATASRSPPGTAGCSWTAGSR